MNDRSAPIGLFDSGIGGLTVARQVMKLLPNENTVYFGDTARVPYGSKSPETVIGYALQAAAFLESFHVKMIIIACGTASATALEQVRGVSSVPVIGVVEPSARSAAETSATGRIGVIATEGSIRSQAYQNAITEFHESAIVSAKACPLFVPLVEEGYVDHPATHLFAREYLAPLLKQSIDTLILGCTHYPLLADAIADVLGPDVALIDPGIAAAGQAATLLDGLNLRNTSTVEPRHEYYLSDFPHKFVEVGERFLGCPFHHVHRVHIEDLPHVP